VSDAPQTYVWATVRARFVERVGDTPSARQEQTILDAFQQHPTLVVEALDHVATRYEQGAVRAAWPVLAKHVERAVDVAARSGEEVSDSVQRDRAVDRARQWVRAAGLHFDREEEVEDELFGVRGSLRWWGSDAELREELLDEWRRLRPRGVEVEREAEERARAWVATTGAKRRAEIATARRRATTVEPRPKEEPEPASTNPLL